MGRVPVFFPCWRAACTSVFRKKKATRCGTFGVFLSHERCNDSSYPEGNFEENQLLGGSMSLSPLYQTQTNDLHVSITTGFHPSFPGLRRSRA